MVCALSMPQIVAASERRSSAGAFFLASFSYCLKSAETFRWSSVRRSTASAVFIVRGAVFSPVFSPVGGCGAPRTDAFGTAGLRVPRAAGARELPLRVAAFFAGPARFFAAAVPARAALAFLRA